MRLPPTLTWLLATASLCPLLPSQDAAAPGAEAAPAVALPVHFVANHGQWSDEVAFCTSGGSAVTWVLGDGFAQRFERWSQPGGAIGGRRCEGAVLRMRVQGGHGRPVGEDPQGGVFHFHRGAVQRSARAFAAARIVDVVPGVDLVLRPQVGRATALAYDLHLAAGADPASLVLLCEGAAGLRLGEDGSLRIAVPLPGGDSVDVRLSAPVSWQIGPTGRVPRDVRFRLLGDDRYGFVAADLDPALPLVIDPGIVWSTLVGGGATDSIADIAWQPGRGIWVGGFTSSTDLPVAPGAFALTGSSDGFVARLEEDGRTLVWASYLGGSVGEEVRAVAVDDQQRVTAVGWTRSPDFPVTSGAVRSGYSGSSPILDIGDAFVTRFAVDGASLVGSTFLGSVLDEVAEGVAIGPDGDAFVTGWTVSPGFPTTAGSFQPGLGGPVTLQSDGFVVRLSPDATTLRYGTYLGGANADSLLAIAVDDLSRATVVGRTVSVDFPVTAAALQSANAGTVDGVAARLAADGSALLWSTYLGGGETDALEAVAIAPDGSTWLGGFTSSTDLVLSAGALQRTLAGRQDGYLARLSVDGASLLAATLIGGPDADAVRGIALQRDGAPVVVGETAGGTPVTPGAPQPAFGGGQLDGFVVELLADVTTARFGTLLGGTADDFLVGVATAPDGTVLVGGSTFSPDYPTTAGALQAGLLGTEDGSLTLLDPAARISGALVVAAVAGPPARPLLPAQDVEVLAFQLENTTPRLLLVQELRVFVGGSADPRTDLVDVTVWYDDPGTPGERDLQVGGPLALPVRFGEVLLPLSSMPPLAAAGQARLRIVARAASVVAAGRQLQFGALAGSAWRVVAEGAGGGPVVTVASPARLAGPLLQAGEAPGFPVDLDGDGALSVVDLRRLCNAIGEVVPVAEDPDGDGVVTAADAALLRDAMLQRPAVLRCPAIVERGQWLQLDGYFPAGMPSVAIDGRALVLGATTGRALTLLVASDQAAGAQELVVSFPGRRPIRCPVVVQ